MKRGSLVTALPRGVLVENAEVMGGFIVVPPT
jgi:hypothetical protein